MITIDYLIDWQKAKGMLKNLKNVILLKTLTTLKTIATSCYVHDE